MKNENKNQHSLSVNFILFFLAGIFLLTIREEFNFRPWLWLLPILLLTFHTSLPHLKMAFSEKLLLPVSLAFTGVLLAANFSFNKQQDILPLLATFAGIWSLKRKHLLLWILASIVLMVSSPAHLLLLVLLLTQFSEKDIRKIYGSLLIACAAGVSLAVFFFMKNTPEGWNGDVMPILRLSDSPAFWEVLQSFYVSKWMMVFPFYQRLLVGMIVSAACVFAFGKMPPRSTVSLLLSALLIAIYAFPFQTGSWFLVSAFSLILLLRTEHTQETQETPSPLEWPWYAFLVTRIFLLLSLVPHGTDVVYYRKIAARIFDGQIPYINFPVEYPPLALLPITAAEYLSRFLGQANFDSFRLYHSLIYFLIEAAFFRFLCKLQSAHKISQASVWLYVAGGFILGDLLYDRLDLIFAITLSLTIYWMSEKQFLKAAIFLYAGIFFKLVSVVLLPLLFVLITSSDKDRKEKFQQFAMLTAMGLGLVLICQGLFGSSYLGFLNYHLARGIQIESLWATLAYVFTPIYLKADYGAIHLYEASPQFLLLTMIVPVLALSLVYTTIWMRRAHMTAASIRNWSFLIILIFMVFGKVFSPQFMIWILCLYPLGESAENNRDKTLNYIVMLGTLSITCYCYRNYGELLKKDMLVWGLLLARNLSLVGWQLMLTWKSGLSFKTRGPLATNER